MDFKSDSFIFINENILIIYFLFVGVEPKYYGAREEVKFSPSALGVRPREADLVAHTFTNWGF